MKMVALINRFLLNQKEVTHRLPSIIILKIIIGAIIQEISEDI